MKRSSVGLPRILRHLPDRDRDERPPFLRTLALLDALEYLGCPCEPWSAIIESPWKIQVITAVRMRRWLLDWHGFHPYDYPSIYPIYQQGLIRGETGRLMLPEKREQAVERYPETREQVRRAVEWALLERDTSQARGEHHAHRL